MRSGLTEILQNVDGSAGRDKTDERPVPNLATHAQAAEWNKIKRAVVELSEIFGDADADTADSLDRILRSIYTGPRMAKWRISSPGTDFLEKVNTSLIAVSGSGSALRIAAENPGQGAGYLSLSHTNAIGTASYVHDSVEELICFACFPRVKFRFRVGAGMTVSDVRIGMANIPRTTLMEVGWDHTGTFRLYVASADGAGSTNVALSSAPATAIWYEVEIYITDTKVGVLLDGVEIGSVATSSATPNANDYSQPFGARITRFGTTNNVDVDWYYVEGNRL